MLAFNKTIAYTKNWLQTFWIGSILGLFFSMLIIFLKPFDTGVVEIPYLTIKLIGYGFCFLFTILLVHFIENYFYKKQHKRWYIVNEAVYILITFFLLTTFSYLYHWIFISLNETISIQDWFGFITNYGLPFLPILLPLWLYLRSKFGVIEINSAEHILAKAITITGNNKAEELTIGSSSFVYAQSQQNYVTIFYKTENGIEQKMLRSTLSNLNKQLPDAWQVHRSYLVNLDYLKSVEGNARKRFMHLTVSKNPIPVSQKYFVALQKHLADSSQNIHK